jgi:hypothetical protein
MDSGRLASFLRAHPETARRLHGAETIAHDSEAVVKGGPERGPLAKHRWLWSTRTGPPSQGGGSDGSNLVSEVSHRPVRVGEGSLPACRPVVHSHPFLRWDYPDSRTRELPSIGIWIIPKALPVPTG